MYVCMYVRTYACMYVSLLYVALVVLTTLVGYAMAPGSLSSTTLILGCLGTALCSASANTINQVSGWKYYIIIILYNYIVD